MTEPQPAPWGAEPDRPASEMTVNRSSLLRSEDVPVAGEPSAPAEPLASTAVPSALDRLAEQTSTPDGPGQATPEPSGWAPTSADGPGQASPAPSTESSGWASGWASGASAADGGGDLPGEGTGGVAASVVEAAYEGADGTHHGPTAHQHEDAGVAASVTSLDEPVQDAPPAWNPTGSTPSAAEPAAWQPSGSQGPSQHDAPPAWQPSGGAVEPAAWQPTGSAPQDAGAGWGQQPAAPGWGQQAPVQQGPAQQGWGQQDPQQAAQGWGQQPGFAPQGYGSAQPAFGQPGFGQPGQQGWQPGAQGWAQASAPKQPSSVTWSAELVAGIAAVVLVVLGVSIPEDGSTDWGRFGLWSAFGIVAAVLTLAQPLEKALKLGPQRAKAAAVVGGLGLAGFWVLFILPGINRNTSFLVTLGCAAGGAVAWLASGRSAPATVVALTAHDPVAPAAPAPQTTGS